MSTIEGAKTSEHSSPEGAPADAAPLLRIKNLVKRYGLQTVLHGVDLDISAGRVVALIGASGSGKSTLLRCINYLEVPDPGSEIWLDGELIGQDTRKATPRLLKGAALRRQRSQIGMVFQHFNLFPTLPRSKTLPKRPWHIVEPLKRKRRVKRRPCSIKWDWTTRRRLTRASCRAGSSNESPSPGPLR